MLAAQERYTSYTSTLYTFVKHLALIGTCFALLVFPIQYPL